MGLRRAGPLPSEDTSSEDLIGRCAGDVRGQVVADISLKFVGRWGFDSGHPPGRGLLLLSP